MRRPLARLRLSKPTKVVRAREPRSMIGMPTTVSDATPTLVRAHRCGLSRRGAVRSFPWAAGFAAARDKEKTMLRAMLESRVGRPPTWSGERHTEKRRKRVGAPATGRRC